MKILGIDPGFATLGFAILEKRSPQPHALTWGVIQTSPRLPHANRLAEISSDLTSLLSSQPVDLACVEELFFLNNITTGIPVAQARGVVLSILAQHNLPILEIKPSEVKLSICGNGRAEKSQVQKMTQTLLHLPSLPRPDDAADALAIALAGLDLHTFTSALPQNKL